MRIYRSTPWLAVCLGIALFTGAAPSHAAIGARVLLQQWSPYDPSKQPVHTVADDPSVVSDAMQKAWSEARPRICAALVNAMGKGGAAAGQTLHDIDCVLDESVVLNIASTGPTELSATLAVSGYIEASSTTPTIIDRVADPRFSIALTARVALAISVQPNRYQTLRIDKAQFRLSDATLDSHNLSGDLLKFVAEDLSPYFHGPNYRRLAEAAIDAIAIDLAGRFNSALTPVNAALRGPGAAVRIAVWGKPDAIVVAFGPRELAPQVGGTMFGAMRWDTTKMPPGTCESFRIDATVQTGPAPLRDPSGYYEPGDAPRRNLGSFKALTSMAGGECLYRLSNIAIGWPNSLKTTSTIDAGKSTGNSLHSTHYALVPDGWDGRTVVAQPNSERNYVIRGTIEASAVVDPAATLKHGAVNPADPRIQVADRLTTEAAPSRSQGAMVGQGKAAPSTKAATTFGTRARAANTDAVALNPQPLPPDPPEATPAARRLGAVPSTSLR